MSNPSNVQKFKALLEELDNTPHQIGLVLLGERLLVISHLTKEAIKKEPETFRTDLSTPQMYLDLCDIIEKHLKAEGK